MVANFRNPDRPTESDLDELYDHFADDDVIFLNLPFVDDGIIEADMQDDNADGETDVAEDDDVDDLEDGELMDGEFESGLAPDIIDLSTEDYDPDDDNFLSDADSDADSCRYEFKVVERPAEEATDNDTAPRP